MSKVLFLNQPSVGHLNTLLSIALQMKTDGHLAHFLLPGMRDIKTHIPMIDTGQALPGRIRQNGLGADIMPLAAATLWGGFVMPFKSGFDEILHAQWILTAGLEHYTRQILKFITSDRPDVLVTDFAFVATSLAAEIAEIPYVVIYHSGLPFRGEGIPPFGSGLPIGVPFENSNLVQRENRALKLLDGRVNAVRGKMGLPALGAEFLRRPYSPWLNLITSASAIEAPRSNLTENTFFVGPCFGQRAEAGGFPFEGLRADKFKIYVSLGTVFNNKPEVFRKIIRALDHPDYQLIVSAGGAWQSLQKDKLPPTTLLFKSVPQIALLPQVDLFISHGGNNSTNEALASGKPIIVMPVGGEQADNASRVEYLGVGKRLDMQTFSETDLQETVAEMRVNPAYQQRVLAIQTALQSTQGVVTASRCIAWVAQNRRPLRTQAGLPLTLTPEHLGQLFGDSGESMQAGNL